MSAHSVSPPAGGISNPRLVSLLQNGDDVRMAGHRLDVGNAQQGAECGGDLDKPLGCQPLPAKGQHTAFGEDRFQRREHGRAQRLGLTKVQIFHHRAQGWRERN
jgi:hypothetical protein